MKKINEYSRKEKAHLTNEQVKQIIKEECMRNGVPLLPEKPEKPTKPAKPNIEGDITIYEVGDFQLKDKKVADKIQELLTGKAYRVDWDYKLGSDFEYLKGNKNIDIATKKVFTEQTFENEISPELEKWKSEEDKYDEKMGIYSEELEEYESIKEEREDIAERVWELVNEAKRYHRKRDTYITYFKEYLTMAEGDFETALRFYVKSYDEAPYYFEDMEAELKDYWSELAEVLQEQNNE